MKSKIITLISIFLMLSLFQPAAAQPKSQREIDGAKKTRSIILPFNKSAIIESPVTLGEIIIANPEIVSAVLNSPQRLFIIGKKTGQTNAIFLDREGNQILTLEIAVEPDVRELEITLNSLFPDSRVVVSVINETIILKGTVTSSAQAASIVDVTSKFIGDDKKVVNLLKTLNSEQVMLRVRVVEMKRTFLKQLGVGVSGVATVNNSVFNFGSTAATSTLNSNGLSLNVSNGPIGSLQGSEINFKALEDKGYIKTLAEPNVTALTGEEAEILVGGEYPIPVGGSNGTATISFKKYGVSVNFTPIVLSDELIHLSMSTEVSQLTAQNSVSLSIPGSSESLSIPGTDTRKVKTSAELSSGQSLVVAGLLQENIQSLLKGVPTLMNIPVLGQLFRSEEFITEQTELAVIVTPYLAVPTNINDLTDPTEGHQVANMMQALLFGQIEANYGIDRTPGETQIQAPVGYIVD